MGENELFRGPNLKVIPAISVYHPNTVGYGTLMINLPQPSKVGTILKIYCTLLSVRLSI